LTKLGNHLPWSRPVTHVLGAVDSCAIISSRATVPQLDKLHLVQCGAISILARSCSESVLARCQVVREWLKVNHPGVAAEQILRGEVKSDQVIVGLKIDLQCRGVGRRDKSARRGPHIGARCICGQVIAD
jgi:hypothetical protein